MKPTVKPFLCTTPNNLRNLAWQQFTGDIPLELPAALLDWDAAYELIIGTRFDLDLLGIINDCELAFDDRIRVALLWRCKDTGLRGVIQCLEFGCSDATRRTVELLGSIPSNQLRGAVVLVVQIALATPGNTAASPLSPRVPGSVLLEIERSLTLEGGAAQFPMEMISFSSQHQPFASGAGWCLEWPRGSWESQFLGSVRLYLNTDHPTVVDAVTQPRPELRYVREAIIFDTYKTIVAAALESEEFISAYDQFEPGSIGAVAANLIAVLLPTYSVETAASEYRNERDLLFTHIQASLKLFMNVQKGAA